MTQKQKMDLIQESLIEICQESLARHYDEPMFDMWLSMDADMVFGDNYIDLFKEHYGDYITEEIESRLWFAGKNILYAINAFIFIKNNDFTIYELLHFVEKFISNQFIGFFNDYSDFDYGTWKEESEQESKI